MGGLALVIRAGLVLQGEKHTPELPLPFFVVDQYAKRMGLSPGFSYLVRYYDTQIRLEMDEKRDKGKPKVSKKPKVPAGQVSQAAKGAIRNAAKSR